MNDFMTAVVAATQGSDEDLYKSLMGMLETAGMEKDPDARQWALITQVAVEHQSSETTAD